MAVSSVDIVSDGMLAATRIPRIFIKCEALVLKPTRVGWGTSIRFVLGDHDFVFTSLILSLLATNDEEYLESQAQDIDREISRLQARIRGFVYRFRAGSIKLIPGHSSTGRRQVEKIAPFSRKAAEDSAYHDLNDGTKYNEAAEDDPSFAETNFDDVPNGWLVAYISDGTPHFVQTETGNSTWAHPRQSDASKLFGADFNLCWAWKQYYTHRKLVAPPSGLETPTIGELAVYFRAINGCVEPSTKANWWRESDSSSPSQSLCEVCRHINFDALFHTTSAWGQTSAIPLGSLRSISKKTRCALCRLVTKTASPEKSSGDLLRMLDEIGGIIRCTLIENQEWTRFSTRIRTVYLDLQLAEQKYSPQQSLGYGRIHQILRHDERPPEQKFNDSYVVKDQINFVLLKAWLQICEQQHQSMVCEPNMAYPSFTHPTATDIYSQFTLIKERCLPLPLSENSLKLTLIDVEIGCLVDTEPDVRYITLSYVWGGPQPFRNTKTAGKKMYTPGAISTEDVTIPQTLRDAIKVVELLGERYLWVDSLCIIQDSTREKMEQISNMGNIYSRAVLTLVAAYGSSCHAGIPGVRAGSRNTAQHVEEIEGMLLSNELRYLHEIMDDLVWNTRGWTYQERELSKRCLYFTEKCVYFSCNQVVCKEDSGLRNVSLWGEKHMRIRTEKHPIWNNYRRAVKKFTARTFTLDEDVVNAFEGIASLLQPVFKSDFIYGLPETELDLALLWQPASDIHRRINKATGEHMFPSWSWAGWVGEIDYVWTKHLLDDLSRVQWQVQAQHTDEQEYITSDQLRAPRSGRHGVWEYVENIHNSATTTPYYYQPKHPGIWCLHPTASKESRIPRPLLRPGTHELRFKAQTAMLRIVVKPHTISPFDYGPLSSCTYNRHILCPVPIISTDNFVAGTLYAAANTLSTLQSGSHEFIRISRRRGYAGDTIGLPIYANYPSPETYPQPQDDIASLPNHPTLYPAQYGAEKSHDKYDQARFNKNKPWPLYNVMLIERKGERAFRVAVGIVHITAFLQAGMVEKLILLA